MEIPKCINGNTAINICTSEDCNHPNPFICANCLNNQCNQLHEDCITPQWNKTKNTIEKSKKLNAPDFIKISNAVQQTILKAMKYLQKQLEYFNDWKSTFGMPNEAVNLFRCIKNNQEHKFTGMQISRILKDLKREHEIKKLNEEMIKQQMNEVLSQMEQTQKMIRQIYSIWDQELSLEIKQQLLDNLYWMSDCSQKPSDLKIKCNKIGIQGVYMNQFSHVIICELMSVYFNMNRSKYISKSIQKQPFINSQVFISISIQGVLCLNINLDVTIYQLLSVNFNINFKLVFYFQFSWYIQYHSGVFIFSFFQLHTLAQLILNNNFKALKSITLYYPWTLGCDSQIIKAQSAISQSLLNLPQLLSVTIIANDIKSKDGFKSLGKKVKIYKDEGWHQRQEW